MNNRKISKFLRKTKPNSGFTLTELLTGLIMSIFVTGALGFGLYKIMQVTAREDAKTSARNEASRAIEFISDEMRRASEIDADETNALGVNSSGNLLFDPNNKTIVLALNIPEINNSATLGSDGDATTSERVIYYLETAASGGTWQGPQVLYRWGPPLDADGNYTTGNWQPEALIDGIDDKVATNPCTTTGDILTTASAKGFYACLTDDDGDGVVETEITDTNGNGTIDNDDINRIGRTAQIYLTGGIDTIANNGTSNDSNYTAETQVVARSNSVNVDAPAVVASVPITFRSLEADYVCNLGADLSNPSDDEIWTMRTDFDNTAYNSSGERPNRDQATTWIHEEDRQAQPINISPDADLIINSIPIGATGCLNASSGNEGALESDLLSTFVDANGVDNLDTDGDTYIDTHSVSHTIKFKASISDRPGGNDSDFWKTFNGNSSTTTDYNNPNISGTDQILVFKNGSRIGGNQSGNNIPAPFYKGYDYDGDGNPDRDSLGDFLVQKGYAIDNGNDTYTIDGLKDDERIIAIEIGHTDTTHPGFDVQDNVFIMTNEIFEQTH